MDFAHQNVGIDGDGCVRLDTHGLKDTETRLTMNDVLTHIDVHIGPCRDTWMVWDDLNKEQHVFSGGVLTMAPRRPADRTRARRCREGMALRQMMHKRWTDDACVLCKVHGRDNMTYPCGHMDLCDGCCDMVQLYVNACPTCRMPIYLRISVNGQ